jgi:hypothetical protein
MTVAAYRWSIDQYHQAVNAGVFDDQQVELKTDKLVVFRDPFDGDYESKQTYTTGTISPLAFADVVVSIDIVLGLDSWEP